MKILIVDDHPRVEATQKDSTTFAQLVPEDAAVMKEALRVGPGAGYFAYRVLSDSIVIQLINAQIACG